MAGKLSTGKRRRSGKNAFTSEFEAKEIIDNNLKAIG